MTTTTGTVATISSAKNISAKDISAKNSLGVFAECPHCHSPIQHGFQICGDCGHPVSAAEQQMLRNLLKKSVAIHFTIFVVAMAIGLSVFNRFF